MVVRKCDRCYGFGASCLRCHSNRKKNGEKLTAFISTVIPTKNGYWYKGSLGGEGGTTGKTVEQALS